MALKLHSPPGFVNDFTGSGRQQWSALISKLIKVACDDSTPQFYDATKDTEADAKTAVVTWIGFPKQVKETHPTDEDRWKAADLSRDVQDEYLEWSVQRNNENKITKIVFCNEGPEYYQFLAQFQRQTLYQLYVANNPGVHILIDDLYHAKDGKYVYNPRNKWNDSSATGTIMHLIQKANTLGAEITLGAEATIVRKKNGALVTDSDALIKCSEYGQPGRNSDPTIGIAVNDAVREQKRKLTLDDPIGLYIHSVDFSSITPPAGHDDDEPKDFWKWTRGTDGHYMRAVFEVPEGKGYVLGDLHVNRKPLKYGAQIADLIHIALTARISSWDGQQPEPQECVHASAASQEIASTEGGTGLYAEQLEEFSDFVNFARRRGPA